MSMPSLHTGEGSTCRHPSRFHVLDLIPGKVPHVGKEDSTCARPHTGEGSTCRHPHTEHVLALILGKVPHVGEEDSTCARPHTGEGSTCRQGRFHMCSTSYWGRCRQGKFHMCSPHTGEGSICRHPHTEHVLALLLGKVLH